MLNLSQEQLSERLGISRNFLSSIERGIKTPSLETLIKISNFFNLGIDEFITGKLNFGYKIEADEIYANLELLEPKDRRTAIKIFSCIVDELYKKDKKYYLSKYIKFTKNDRKLYLYMI